MLFKLFVKTPIRAFFVMLATLHEILGIPRLPRKGNNRERSR